MAWECDVREEVEAIFRPFVPDVFDPIRLEKWAVWRRERVKAAQRKKWYVARRVCVICRVAFDVPLGQKGPTPVHCSRRCLHVETQRRYKSRHRDEINSRRRKLTEPFVVACAACGGEFTISITSLCHSKKFCSRRCSNRARQKAYRAAHPERIAARKKRLRSARAIAERP